MLALYTTTTRPPPEAAPSKDLRRPGPPYHVGVLHADVKPDNIMADLRASGSAIGGSICCDAINFKLIDFSNAMRVEVR